jgi:outer membrane protein assembly factor BamB
MDADQPSSPARVRARGRVLPGLRALGAALLAATLSGCWLQLGAGSANTRSNGIEDELTRANVASLAEQWRTPIDSFVTEPIVSGGRIFVTNRVTGSGEGNILEVLAVQAYDRDTGALVWERSLLPADGTPVTGHIETPALEDGALWVPYWHEGLGPCDGRLARLDPATGAILSSDATGPQQSAVVAAGSSVAYVQATCAGSGGPQLVVRDRATRAVRWTHTFPAGSGIATPTIGGGRLFLNAGGILSAFAADGCGASVCAPVWTEAVGRSFFDFLRPAVGPGGSLITIGPTDGPGTDASLVVRDAATGDRRWRAPLRYDGSLPGAITGVAVDGGTVYVSGARQDAQDPSEDEAILDAYPVAGCGQTTCAPSWTTSFGATRPAREPAVAAGVVYVPLVAGDTTAPAVAAADAGGCGAAQCSELVRVPLVGGSGPFLQSAQPYVMSVAEGGVFVGWLPDLYGPTRSQLIALSAGGA